MKSVKANLLMVQNRLPYIGICEYFTSPLQRDGRRMPGQIGRLDLPPHPDDLTALNDPGHQAALHKPPYVPPLRNGHSHNTHAGVST